MFTILHFHSLFVLFAPPHHHHHHLFFICLLTTRRSRLKCRRQFGERYCHQFPNRRTCVILYLIYWLSLLILLLIFAAFFSPKVFRTFCWTKRWKISNRQLSLESIYRGYKFVTNIFAKYCFKIRSNILGVSMS